MGIEKVSLAWMVQFLYLICMSLAWLPAREPSSIIIQHGGYFDELVQEKRNPTALAMELRLSCTKPSICVG